MWLAVVRCLFNGKNTTLKEPENFASQIGAFSGGRSFREGDARHRADRPRRTSRAVSEDSEHEADGPVDLSCLHGVKATGEVAQPAGVDRAHLVDEYAGPGSVQLNLRPEDRRLRAGGSRGDDQRGEQDSVTLDRNCVPGATLLVPGGVLARAQPEQVTTH
jgi:hypothetical protein